MKIIEDTLAYDMAMRRVGGKLVVLNDSTDEHAVAADLPVPGLSFEVVAGRTYVGVKRIGEAVWLRPDGPWLYAIVVPEPLARSGSRAVDTANVGRALVRWSEASGLTPAPGRMSARQGAAEAVIGWASVTIAGAGAASSTLEPPLLATPVASPVDAFLRFRGVVSPGTTMEFGPSIQFV